MNRSRYLAVAFCVLSAAVCWAESSPSLGSYIDRQFPDNTDLRVRLFSHVIGAPRELAEAYGEHVFQSRAGAVTVRVVPGDQDFFVEFINGTGVPYSQGSCIIKRSNSMGYLVQAKIFLQDDPGCYLRLYVSGEGTRADVVMYGAVLKRGMYISGMLYQILMDSFGDMVRQTGYAFDWKEVFGLGERAASDKFADSLRGAFANATSTNGLMVKSGGAEGEGTLALASATRPGGAKDSAIGRAYKLSLMVDNAANADALIASLAASGESPKELTTPDGALGFEDVDGSLDVNLPYDRFPTYEPGKGILPRALLATLYLDELSHADSIYAVLGENLHMVVVPTSDKVGLLGFAYFSKGRELSWSEAVKQLGSNDLVRVVRLGASRS